MLFGVVSGVSGLWRDGCIRRGPHTVRRTGGLRGFFAPKPPIGFSGTEMYSTRSRKLAIFPHVQYTVGIYVSSM